jgi:hypothetical protein
MGIAYVKFLPKIRYLYRKILDYLLFLVDGFLGDFEKFGKATITFVISAFLPHCLSA